MKLIRMKLDSDDPVLSQLCSDFVDQTIGTLKVLKSDLARNAKILQSVKYEKTPEFLEALKIYTEFEKYRKEYIDKLMAYRRRIMK